MVDGFKPGQRKILFCAFKRNLKSDIKVAQLVSFDLFSFFLQGFLVEKQREKTEEKTQLSKLQINSNRPGTSRSTLPTTTERPRSRARSSGWPR